MPRTTILAVTVIVAFIALGLYGVVSANPGLLGGIPTFLPIVSADNPNAPTATATTIAATPSATTEPSATSEPGPSPTASTTPVSNPDARIVGYFPEWSVYDRAYFVKNIVTSGSAAKLTHINYAFSNVSEGLECTLGDTYADYDMAYTAENSVDGVADTWDAGVLRGNFNQLRKLKEQYPDLKVMISVGGWTWSSNFSDAALTAESRQHFVQSCIDLFIKGQFSPDLTYPGIFDGIDIDWEYPAACGNTCDYRPEDTQNFTLLLAEFRSQLDALSTETGQPYQLTIAAPSGEEYIDKLELNNIHLYLDFINLMAYDFHIATEATTNFHSPLYGSPDDPTYDVHGWADYAVQKFLDGGVPPNKLVLGVPFYGRGWQGVPNVNDGLYQTGSGGAPGTYEAGIEDYHVLKALEATYGTFRHPETQAFWIYSPTTQIFWSYDDPTSLAAKMEYVQSKGLGGAMFWELSGDDDEGSLISAIARGLE